MTRERVLASGLCCAALAFTHAARAEPSVKLVWQGGTGTEGCAKGGEIQRAAEMQLGKSVFSTTETAPTVFTIRVDVEQRQEPRGFHATVWVEADDNRDPGTRELDAAGNDCHALDEPLALVVALMADTELARPVEVEEPPPPEPEPPPPPAPKPPPIDDSERDLAPIETGPTEPPTPWRVEIGASLLGGYAVLPTLSAGADLALLLDPSSFPAMMLHGAAYYPREEQVGAGASVRFFFAHAGVALCPELWASNSAMLRGCVGPAVGALHADSEGLIGGRDTTRLVIASELGLRGRFELGSGALATAALSFLLPLRPESYTYKSDGRSENIFQMGHLAIVASLGGAYEIR